MFRIQPEQHAALAKLAIDDFIADAIGYFRARLPEALAGHDDAAARALFRDGIDRARAHGVVLGWGVCVYVALMLALGRDFERDHGWAAELLTAEGDPHERIERLLDQALREGKP